MWTEPGKLARARELRAGATEAERILWQGLRAKRLGGLKFHRQHPIAEFFVDFVCRQAMLIIELDGVSHEGQAERDSHRQAKLESLGFEVMRFKNQELQALDRVLAAIEKRAKERIAEGVPVVRF